MLKKQMAGGAALALVLTTLCASAASAAVISQTLHTSLPLNSSGTLDFNSFDPTLGTLTDVTATLSGGVETSIQVLNTSGTSQNIDVFIRGMVTLSGPGSLSFDRTYIPVIGLMAAPGETTGEVGITYGPGSQSGVIPLADFIGSASIEISVTDSAEVTGGLESCCSLKSLTGTDRPTVTLQYTFTPASTPVPEPSTWAMLLLGFAGLGYAGYRQTRSAEPQAAIRA